MSEYIRRVIVDISKLLKELEESIKIEYAEFPDNPGIVLQMKSVTHIKNTLNQTFPLSEEVVPQVVMYEDKKEDVAASPLIAGKDEIPEDIPAEDKSKDVQTVKKK